MSFLESIFGAKPEIADFIPTNLRDESAKAISTNKTNLADLGTLADELAIESGEATRKGIDAVTPGGTENIDKATEQIKSFLGGEVPDDVADEIARRTAELSTQRGVTPRSGIGNNFTARELGLTSLGLVQQGIGMAQTWMQSSQSGFQQLNFGGMFVSPQDQASWTAQQREAERTVQQDKYNMEAAPNPVASGITKLALTAAGAVLTGGASLAVQGAMGGLSGIFGGQKEAASVGYDGSARQAQIDTTNNANKGKGFGDF